MKEIQKKFLLNLPTQVKNTQSDLFKDIIREKP